MNIWPYNNIFNDLYAIDCNFPSESNGAGPVAIRHVFRKMIFRPEGNCHHLAISEIRDLFVLVLEKKLKNSWNATLKNYQIIKNTCDE